MSDVLKAPFPWFGGKSRAASIIWDRFGDVPNYVEPFAGSLAVLLGRPHEARTETVNDLDCYLANFWRAVKADPRAVAQYADQPVNEADLSARHAWLVARKEVFAEHMQAEPRFYEAETAGWWVWGACCWIGSGWCSGEGPWVSDGMRLVNVKDAHVGDAGVGVNRQLPHVGDAGNQQANDQENNDLYAWMNALCRRLRRVRVCCGDWTRVTGESVTTKHGMTAILLDPPYADTAKRTSNVYAEDSATVAHDVRQWAIANGDNPLLRIALCGYESEHAMPSSWECVAWKSSGGYGSQANKLGRANSSRERIWFSPACLKPETQGTFTL